MLGKISIFGIILATVQIYVQSATIPPSCAPGVVPKNADDCKVGSTATQACCQVSAPGQSTCALLPMNMTYITPYIKTGNYSGAIIPLSINCGSSYVATSTNLCGTPNPKTIGDCSSGNTNTSRCCFYASTNDATDTFCVAGGNTNVAPWLGIDMALINFVGLCQSSSFLTTSSFVIFAVLLLF